MILSVCTLRCKIVSPKYILAYSFVNNAPFFNALAALESCQSPLYSHGPFDLLLHYVFPTSHLVKLIININ